MTFFYSLVCIVAGFIMVRYPQKAWAIRHLLSVKDGEPTKLFLISCRVFGAFALLVGIVGLALSFLV